LATEKDDPRRTLKIVGGGAAGAGLGAGLAHLTRDRGGHSSGSEREASNSAAAGTRAAGDLQNLPVAAKPKLPAERSSAVSPQDVESRLQSSEQQMRQQVVQQAQQQAVQEAASREHAAILRDQGKVQARLQHLLAPGTTRSAGGPRNIQLGPGVRAKTPDSGSLQKRGQEEALSRVYNFFSENPWALGAAAGGTAGGLMGWSANAPTKVRKRQALVRALLGAGVGAAGAQTLSNLSRAADKASTASDAMRDVAEQASAGLPSLQAGAQDMMGSVDEAAGAMTDAARAVQTGALGAGTAGLQLGGLASALAGRVRGEE